jgi:hypothetical protein
MKLFNIQVHTSDRNFDITLRNLTIIRASQIIHRISVAYVTLIRSIKRFLVPGKLVIQPLIRIGSIKSLRQRADVAVDALPLISSRKRVTMADAVQVSADNNISSLKRMRDSAAWRVITNILHGSKKRVAEGAAVAVDVDLRMQKVRKRRLGECGLLRLADMDPMTLDALDYIVEQ